MLQITAPFPVLRLTNHLLNLPFVRLDSSQTVVRSRQMPCIPIRSKLQLPQLMQQVSLKTYKSINDHAKSLIVMVQRRI